MLGCLLNDIFLEICVLVLNVRLSASLYYSGEYSDYRALLGKTRKDLRDNIV